MTVPPRWMVRPHDRYHIEERIRCVPAASSREVSIVVRWRTGHVWMSESPDLTSSAPARGTHIADYDDEELYDADRAWVIGAESATEAATLAGAWDDALDDGLAIYGWHAYDRELWFSGALDVRAVVSQGTD